MSKVKVVVIGASGFGRETLDVLDAMHEEFRNIEVLGVLDDSPSTSNLRRLSERRVTYLGSVNDFLKNPIADTRFVVGIGKPAIRQEIQARFVESGRLPFTAIHPNYVIGEETTVGLGSVICAGAVLSTNVTTGESVHVNPSATIGHDSVLEDYVSVNPGAVVSGEVTLGRLSLTGAGAIVLQGLNVGARVTVGAGSVVTKDVPPGMTVMGVPGRW